MKGERPIAIEQVEGLFRLGLRQTGPGSEVTQVKSDRVFRPVSDGHFEEVGKGLQHSADLLHGRPLLVDSGLGLGQGPTIQEQNCLGGQSIASGPSGFLDVGFRRFRDVGVGNVPNIGLVDAHPKGRGAGQDAEFTGNPALLMVIAVRPRHAGVVRR